MEKSSTSEIFPVSKRYWDRALANHQLWLATAGREGLQMRLSRKDLRHVKGASRDIEQAIIKNCLFNE